VIPSRLEAIAAACLALGAAGAAAAAEPFPVSIGVDAGAPGRELEPIWRFFGADEPNYAYMENGRKLLGELGKLDPKEVYFRTHNLLCSGDGTPALKWGSTGVYSEDADGNPVYSWTILDRIFDTYLDAGVRPYAQIGFMPKALSVQPEPYQHDWKPGDDYNRIYTGWAHPPRDHRRWAELVYQWVKHSVERYGKEEVETWYWEVWNEPDIGYWQGKPRDETFHKLHDHAIAGVRRALPSARVGGPDSAYDGRFLRAFLEHCLRGTNHATGEKGTPLDFIAFHAKGGPRIVDGHVRMDMGRQLRAIGDSMRVVASFPELLKTPIVIGESDPDGCAACRAREYPQYGYRNGSLFASYTAASFARKHELAERYGVNLQGALTWSITFEDQPLFAGMRSLATGGIDKPVLNVFRMFSKMGGRRLPVVSDHGASLDQILREGVRGKPDVSALASLDGRRLAVMIWHYHDDDLPGDSARIELLVRGLPAATAGARVELFRIDDEHSNAFTAWKRMGSPEKPSAEQYAELERAGQLARAAEPETVPVKGGEATLRFDLPRQGVSLLVLELRESAGPGEKAGLRDFERSGR
jgi:xylan 1,4-beta-xylosidase